MQRAAREGTARGEKLVRSPVRTELPDLGEERQGAQVLARYGFTREEIDALEN
jgi:hypothetical protein